MISRTSGGKVEQRSSFRELRPRGRRIAMAETQGPESGGTRKRSYPTMETDDGEDIVQGAPSAGLHGSARCWAWCVVLAVRLLLCLSRQTACAVQRRAVLLPIRPCILRQLLRPRAGQKERRQRGRGARSAPPRRPTATAMAKKAERETQTCRVSSRKTILTSRRSLSETSCVTST